MAKSTGNIARVGELLDAGDLAAGPALRADRGPLPGAAQLLRRVARGRGGGDRAARRRCSRRSTAYREDRADDPTLPGAARDARGRRSRRRSTTTSTSRRRSRRCSTWSATSTGGSTARSLSTADAARALALLRDLDARPRRAAPTEADALDADARRRCSTRARRLARRATGRPRTGCATSSRRAASPSRTRATASAGGGRGDLRG